MVSDGLKACPRASVAVPAGTAFAPLPSASFRKEDLDGTATHELKYEGTGVGEESPRTVERGGLVNPGHE
jgi:hypothetical protein